MGAGAPGATAQRGTGSQSLCEASHKPAAYGGEEVLPAVAVERVPCSVACRREDFAVAVDRALCCRACRRQDSAVAMERPLRPSAHGPRDSRWRGARRRVCGKRQSDFAVAVEMTLADAFHGRQDSAVAVERPQTIVIPSCRISRWRWRGLRRM